MQKMAQRRGVLDKLREMSNVSGAAAEKFFNPQFKAVMDTIRKKDDQIRTFVVGKKLGDAEDEPGAPALKDLLKKAKSNLNRREFLSAATDLGIFHDQVKKIVTEIQSIDSKVDEVHHEFLFDKLSPEQQEQLSSFKSRFANRKDALSKEAGIMDFFHNIGTTRGRALAAWEKRYPNEVGKFKNGLTVLLQKSEVLLSTIIDSLKEMSAARNSRKIDDYMAGANKILKFFNNYDSGKGGFKEFYTSVLKPYIAKLDDYKARKSMEETMSNLPAAKSPGENAPITPEELAKLTPAAPTTSPSAEGVKTLEWLQQQRGNTNTVEKPVQQPPAAPPPPNNIVHTEGEHGSPVASPLGTPATPITGKQSEDEHANQLGNMQWTSLAPKPAHRKFYSTLESLAGESPAMLAIFIKKYANSIKNSDPKIAAQLFQVSQRIKG